MRLRTWIRGLAVAVARRVVAELEPPVEVAAIERAVVVEPEPEPEQALAVQPTPRPELPDLGPNPVARQVVLRRYYVRPMTVPQAIVELDGEVTEMSVRSAVVRLTLDGLLARVGRGRYEITEAGRRAALTPRTREQTWNEAHPPGPVAGEILRRLASADALPQEALSDVGASVDSARNTLARLRKRGYLVRRKDGRYAITEEGREAMGRARTDMPQQKAARAPAPVDDPAPVEAANCAEDVLRVLRHGNSLRQREIERAVGGPVDALVLELRRAGAIKRVAPGTWQITVLGSDRLRNVRRAPRREDVDGPADARSDAVAAHVAEHGVTRLPGVGTPGIADANRKREVYRTEMWAPKAMQAVKQRRRARGG